MTSGCDATRAAQHPVRLYNHPVSAILPCEIPLDALLRRYDGGGGYAECYVVEVPGTVTQQAYVDAFYTSPLFKVERAILTHLASRPSTDADVKALAAGISDKFSAWRVESQSPTELLLADFTGHTRSWLKAEAVAGPNESASTLLYFGSAVVPRSQQGVPVPVMGWLFHALLGFHRLYSRMLLSAASKRVSKR